MTIKDFDARAQTFTDLMSSCSRWQHTFTGAAYSTRLAKAVLLAESAIRQTKQLLADDGVDLVACGLRPIDEARVALVAAAALAVCKRFVEIQDDLDSTSERRVWQLAALTADARRVVQCEDGESGT